MIGDQIKKYRTEKGITQEQLGQMLGVTTQAVSRWERGGTPDVEFLPLISDILDVSLDTLFGREEESFPLKLARKLSQMNREDAYQYAATICWAIEIGLLGNVSTIDDYMNRMIDRHASSDDKKTDYFSKIIHDEGLALHRMSPDLQTFFLMVEPKGSLRTQLSDRETLRKVFSIFADEKLLRILYDIHTKADIPMATSLISKHTGLTEPEVDRCMNVLIENHLVVPCVVETADGKINSYVLRRERFVIPLLCFADEIAKKNLRPFLGDYDRTKPFL